MCNICTYMYLSSSGSGTYKMVHIVTDAAENSELAGYGFHLLEIFTGSINVNFRVAWFHCEDPRITPFFSAFALKA